MKKILFVLSILTLFSFRTQSQNIKVSVYSEVSIFTMGPGDALFEAFGHNAIRFKDPVLRMDLVFNYGTFDFRDPNFYTNFAQGRLQYWVGVSSYKNFENNYKVQKRWMKEQVLNLSQNEKQQVFDFLRNNAQPENRNYLYDPFFDNCSTKLRDIIENELDSTVEFNTKFSENGLTFRQAMNKELPWNSWGSFGINTALGSKLDGKMSVLEYMYLPDYLFEALQNSKRESGTEFVSNEKTVLDFSERPLRSSWYNPMFVFSILFLIVLVITYRDMKKKTRSRYLDFLIYFISGLVGMVLCYLWFFTDHKTTPDNFNILWAFPLNLLVSFIFLKSELPNWSRQYNRICLVFIGLIQIVWLIGLQEFTWVFIPLFGIFVLRYGYLSRLLTPKK